MSDSRDVDMYNRYLGPAALGGACQSCLAAGTFGTAAPGKPVQVGSRGSEVDQCSWYVWTSRTRRSVSEFSGRRDVDFGSRYVWASRPRRSLFEVTGSRDVWN